MPPNVGNDFTEQFLREMEFVFNHVGRGTRDVTIRYDRVAKISLFGQLLLYKFVSFSMENRCFFHPQLGLSKYVTAELQKSGFADLIEFYLDGGRKNWFSSKSKVPPRSLKTSLGEDLFIAPLQLLRNEQDQIRIEQEFLSDIKRFYAENPKAISLLSTCVTEIYMNFWEHATIDSGTVMVAKGDLSHFEVLFADTGEGIITTLRSSSASARHVLRAALQCGTTSKPGTNHMGWGLWLVGELCKVNLGELQIFSEGRMVQVRQGKMTTTDCGYWRGTILRLEMPLANPKTVCSLNLPKPKKPIRINWGDHS